MFMPSKRSRTGSLGRVITPYVGPAFVVAVAYVDPGNLATNVTAGSRLRLCPALGDHPGRR